MKASDYIAAMQALIEEHGDLDVETLSSYGARIPVYPPCLSYKKDLQGKGSTPQFWFYFEDESRKGEKVIAV